MSRFYEPFHGMMIAAAIGVIFSHPNIELPAFTGFTGINRNSQLYLLLQRVFFTKTVHSPSITPTQVFATEIATMISNRGHANAYDVTYAIIILDVSVFCLTSLETATRLARYVFQELFVDGGEDVTNLTGYKKLCANSYFATLVTVAKGEIMAAGG